MKYVSDNGVEKIDTHLMFNHSLFLKIFPLMK